MIQANARLEVCGKSSSRPTDCEPLSCVDAVGSEAEAAGRESRGVCACGGVSVRFPAWQRALLDQEPVPSDLLREMLVKQTFVQLHPADTS